MNIIKKINQIITGYVTEDAEGAEVWLVSWKARYGSFQDEWERKAKAFLNKKDAEAFCKSLEDAQALLQYTENINITLKQQK